MPGRCVSWVIGRRSHQMGLIQRSVAGALVSVEGMGARLLLKDRGQHQPGHRVGFPVGRSGEAQRLARLERQARPWRSRRTMARLTAALPITAPQLSGGTGTAETPGSLITAARDLLARTVELPASKRGLHAVISEYRAAVFAFTTEADPQRHGSTR